MADKPSYLDFNNQAYEWKPDIDYKKQPELYRVGKGEQGLLICAPYKSEIGQLVILGTKDNRGSWGEMKVSGTIDGYEFKDLNLATVKDADKMSFTIFTISIQYFMANIYSIPNTEYTVTKEAIECPHCSVSIVPDLFHAIKISSRGNRHIVAFACCVESMCELPFLLEFKQKYNPKDEKWKDKPFIQQDVYNYEYETSLPEDLEAVRDDDQRPYFTKFFEIYEHAHQAHEQGFTEVSGTGFRKSFEFLLKDYAIFCFPEDKSKIAHQPLQQVIKRFSDNKQLNIVAERAAWLGNDQTHYTIDYDDMDVDDLKNLIKSTVFWIHHTEFAKDLLVSMADKRKPAK